jgi:hypothetical protein
MDEIEIKRNRQTKRRDQQKSRFYGESKNYHLTITPQGRYRRRKQIINMEDGERRVIEHYDLKKSSKPKKHKKISD